MAIKVYPVKYEAYDKDTEDNMFIVTAFDEVCSNVIISSVVNSELWPEMSEEILKCLIAIEGK